jgi:hypothetical protein
MRKPFWFLPLLFAVIVAPNLLADTITTTPNPGGTVTLGGGLVLRDSATLSGLSAPVGTSPIGDITFLLYLGGNPLPRDTETINTSGNGTYNTPVGYTVPSGATGVYQWDASYSGDAFNAAVSDNNNPNEQGPWDESVPLPKSARLLPTPQVSSLTGQDSRRETTTH